MERKTYKKRIFQYFLTTLFLVVGSNSVAESDSNFIKLDITENQIIGGTDIVYEEQWSCVEDKNTGLVWEVKTDDKQLRDKNNTYSLLDLKTENDAKISSVVLWSKCTGNSNCDVHSYIDTINQVQLCGFEDWRLPNVEELQTLIDKSKHAPGPLINVDYFPNTVSSWYWTSSFNEEHKNYAWYVLFRNGLSLNDRKVLAKHVRLVHGSASRQASINN